MDNYVTWPDHLVRQIREDRWLLFLGAGVSARSENSVRERPPGWTELLKMLAERLTGDNRRAALDLIAQHQLLQAGEYLAWAFQRENRSHDRLALIADAVDGPPNDRFVPGAIFDALIDLNPRIVVTTNYDKLFERASDGGYKTAHYRSSTLASEIRRGDPVLLKIHGSTDERDHLILTRADYARVRSEGAHSLDVLRSLFLTSTALFVGYSLQDPDIQLLLEIGASGYLNPESHFVLRRSGTAGHEADLFRSTFGVSCLEYPQDVELEDVIRELTNLVGVPQP